MVPALVSLLLAVSAAALTVAGAAAPAATCAGFELHNSSGCTSAGHYQGTKAAGPDACCALCTNQTQCLAWSFHAAGADCYLATNPRLAGHPVADTTCGCRHAGCPPGPPPPPPPPPPPVPCTPVQRPHQPKTTPLPPGKVPPHIVTVLVDDLGFDVREHEHVMSVCVWWEGGRGRWLGIAR
jgi:hypothetical protein